MTSSITIGFYIFWQTQHSVTFILCVCRIFYFAILSHLRFWHQSQIWNYCGFKTAWHLIYKLFLSKVNVCKCFFTFTTFKQNCFNCYENINYSSKFPRRCLTGLCLLFVTRQVKKKLLKNSSIYKIITWGKNTHDV